jgi:hypothetical protein
MTIKDADILKKELKKLEALGSRVGSLAPDSLGKALGARISTRFLPNESFSTQFNINAPAESVLEAACQLFSNSGQIVRDMKEESPYPRISSVVGSGFFNRNLTVVHLEITGFDKAGCTVSLTGVSKEGLIKRWSARKAVIRVIDGLRQSFV